MKIHNKLDEILGCGSQIKILRFLFSEKDEHTGRAIARSINMSSSSTYKTLQGLKAEGLISLRRKGNAVLYKLKEENYFVQKLLMPLLKQEGSIYGDIISLIRRNLLHEKKDIVSIALFGSVARKEETSKSDIDLLIIVRSNNGKDKINRVMDKLNIDIAKKFGASIMPYILTQEEIKIKHVKRQAVIKAILDNNRLIYGSPIERILA